MLRRRFIQILFLSFLSLTLGLNASNVQIDQAPYLRDVSGNAEIVFNISWEHSWRLAKPYDNWDAVWVFAKFKDATNSWQTVYFEDAGHTVAQTDGVTPQFNTGKSNIGGTQRNTGLFMYRADEGTGFINWREVSLVWKYSNQTSTPLTNIKVDVFALEMVYIPQAPFYLGSGSTTEVAAFCYANDPTQAYLVNSENPILLSNNVAQTTALGSRTGTGAGLWPTTGEVTNEVRLPLLFPKGYKPFYSMKYELTQEAYKDFLNKLTLPQQLLRTRLASLAVGENMYVFPTVAATVRKRNGIMLTKIAGEYSFVCNYRKDASMTLEEDADRQDDGQNIAMNYLTLEDGLAYLDWAGLRPLSELEFEKMARGTAAPLSNGFVWSTLYQLSSGDPDALAYMAGTGKETPNEGNYNTSGSPLRVGSFANQKSVRSVAGGGYYGNMELCGNVNERYVSIQYSGAHNFTAEHGDGELEPDGRASYTELVWSILPQHYIFRGGGGNTVALWQNLNHIRTSDRYFYSSGRTQITADNNTGCRGGRTAP